jgi:hypothetical protein
MIQQQMANPDAMQPVLERVAATLRAGRTVWVVGGINNPGGADLPASPPPPPLLASGWHETPYRITWNNQLGWLLHRHATNIAELKPLTTRPLADIEPITLETVTGWKD